MTQQLYVPLVTEDGTAVKKLEYNDIAVTPDEDMRQQYQTLQTNLTQDSTTIDNLTKEIPEINMIGQSIMGGGYCAGKLVVFWGNGSTFSFCALGKNGLPFDASSVPSSGDMSSWSGDQWSSIGSQSTSVDPSNKEVPSLNVFAGNTAGRNPLYSGYLNSGGTGAIIATLGKSCGIYWLNQTQGAFPMIVSGIEYLYPNQ